MILWSNKLPHLITNFIIMTVKTWLSRVAQTHKTICGTEKTNSSELFYSVHPTPRNNDALYNNSCGNPTTVTTLAPHSDVNTQTLRVGPELPRIRRLLV
jgi:hypothetical protein